MSARLRSSTTELEELGEETTLTTSKLRALVQALTGVDIQKDENTFKSIYDILLEIGKEWENLTDVEQASLSEALFGKRNSQVGFAILNNIDRLQEIYALAEDSEGSAMAEQEKYLEGVQYRIDQFQASVENLANTFMSSDFLKNAISVGTDFINLLDKIIDKIGTIPAVIGSAVALGSSKFNPLFEYLNARINGASGNNRIVLNNSSDLSEMATNGSWKELRAIIDDYNNGLKDCGLSQKEFNKTMQNSHTVFGQYMTTLKDGVSPTFNGYIKYLTTTTLKTVGLQIATAALQGVLIGLASAALTWVINKISDYVHATERAIEVSKEAKQNIDEINKSFSSQQQIVKDSGQRFAELSQGVDQLTGKNLSLSDEDYQEFLDISNQLADVFPTLTRHYDENGNAIVDLDGDVNTIASSLRNLLEVEEKLAQQKILDNASDLFDAAIAKNKKLVDDGLYITADDSQLLPKYKEALDSIGIANEVYGALSGEGGSLKISDISKITRENIDKIVEEYGRDLPELIRQLNDIQKEALNNYQSLSSVLATYLYSEYDFAKLSPELQAGVQNLVNNLDWTALDFHSWEEATSWIMDNIVRKIGNDDSLSKTFELSLEANTIFNNGEISVGEYQKRIKDLLPLLEGLDDETRKSIELVLGLEFDSDGNIINTTRNRIQKEIDEALSDITFDNQDTEDSVRGAIDEFIDNLNKDDFELLATLDLDKETSLKNLYKSRDEIAKEMEKYAVEGSSVDLFNRPQVKMDDGSIATVLTQLETRVKDGKGIAFHVTPILPSGEILDEDTLINYVDSVLLPANNAYEADNPKNGGKGILIKADVDLPTVTYEDGFVDVSEEAIASASEWDNSLHMLQGDYYSTTNAADLYYEALQNILNEAKLATQTPFEINLDAKDLETATSGIKELQSTYQTLYEAMQEGKEGSDLAFLMSDIEGLEEKLVDAEGNVVDLGDTWDNFFDIMTDGSHSFEEMEDALNQVLTAYVNSTVDLENFDRAQADAISTQLQLAGVTQESADAYVDAMVKEAEAVQWATDEGYNFATMSEEEIAAMLALAEQSGYSSSALAAYALEKQIVNGITITTSGDINNLIALAEAAGVTTARLAQLAEAKRLLETAEATGDANTANLQRARIKYLTTRAQEDTLAQLKALRNQSANLNYDPSKLKSSGGGGSSSKEEDPWKEAYEKELADLDHLHEMELISDIQYYEEREKLNDKYFKDNEKYTEDYNKNLEEIYKGFQSAYKQYVSDMSDYWQKSLDAGLISFSRYCTEMESMLNSLHDAGRMTDADYYTNLASYYGNVVSNYDKAINAAQRVIKKRIDELEKQKEALEDSYALKKEAIQSQIDGIQSQIDATEKEIEKLEEANKARKEALDMQKALYNLNRAENQRNQMVYKSDTGFVYESNAQDIKDAEEELENLRYEQQVSLLEKTVTALQEQMEGLEDQIESLEAELDNLTEAIDKQIEEMQDYSDRLGEVANSWREAQEDMVAASIWGADWQNSILELNDQTLTDFTKSYIEKQQQQVEASAKAAEAIIANYNAQIEALNDWKRAQATASETPLSSATATRTSTGNSKSVTKNVTKTDASSVGGGTKRNIASKVNAQMGWSSSSKKKYGSGTDNAKPGYHEIAESGDEIVLDNYGNAYLAKGHQLHPFEGGEKVYDAVETQELLRGKYLPIDSIIPDYSSMMSKVLNGNISNIASPTNAVVSSRNKSQAMKIDNSISVNIGDIHVTEVDNAGQLAKAIKNQLPNALLQELNRK